MQMVCYKHYVQVHEESLCIRCKMSLNYRFGSSKFSSYDFGAELSINAAFTLTTIRPRLVHYRGLNRGPIGTIVSNLIRSHHILMSILIIGLIVENILAAKKFSRLPRLAGLS